jgi:hypothetical protein
MSDGQPERTRRGLDPRSAADLGDLLHELTHDKKYRGAIGRIIREAKPDSPHAMAFPEIELEDKFDAREKERETADLKRRQDAWEAQQASARQRLLDGGPEGTGPKYDEDTLGKIKALMDKKGIYDWEDGATLYAATQPPVQKPTERPTVHGATWEIPEFARFGKDPVRASREVAYDEIDRLKALRGRR